MTRALAFPKNIAEIHEMFNLTLGDRRFGVPYCTLCGSAQAYYTDNTDAAEQPVLRTFWLLTRSNKVMYDLVTESVFDTFTARRSLARCKIRHHVGRASLVRSTWGEWKQAHPNTQIIAEDGGIGRSYELDPLGGRDDNGPIFPIGAADDRLDVQELVVGVIAPDGTPLAFPSELSSQVLDAGGEVTLGGVSLEQVGDGLRAVDAATGDDVAAHEPSGLRGRSSIPTRCCSPTDEPLRPSIASWNMSVVVVSVARLGLIEERHESQVSIRLVMS